MNNTPQTRGRVAALALVVGALVTIAFLATRPSAGRGPLDQLPVHQNQSKRMESFVAVFAPRHGSPKEVRELHAAIAEELSRRMRRPAAAIDAGMAPAASMRGQSSLEETDVRAAIEAMRPLLEECFSLGRQEQPDLSSAVAIVDFTVVGDDQVGGVIETSGIGEGSKNVSPTMSECIRETMLTLMLPPPRSHGRAGVVYPFRFGAAATE